MNPPPLPTPSKIEVSSISHKAANYAVIVIPVCFGLTPMLRNFAGVFSVPLIRELITSIPAALLLSAVPAGIIALCGIPQFGKKKLLWKGLTGIIVPVLMILLMIPTVLTIRQKAAERAKVHQSEP